jgi:hypothetical protein
MNEKELDLGPIEGRLQLECTENVGSWGLTTEYQSFVIEDMTALIAEIRRLREDSRNCVAGVKELMDNAKKALDSFPEYNDDWVACNYRYQSYRNAYIRTKNMLDWEDSGMSFVHFKPVKE